MSRPVALVTSIISALVSLALLQRVLRRGDFQVDWFLLGAWRDFPVEERCYLVGVVLACGWAVGRRRPEMLGWVQLYALAVGLWLTQFHWGEQPGEKVDPRFLLALMAGIATLHASYVCLLAHVVIAVRERFEQPRSHQ